MSKILVFVSVLFLFNVFFVSKASAADYCAEDFGTSSVNGTYVENGTYDGQPKYELGSHKLYFCGSSVWCIADTVPADPNLYYSNNSVIISGTWFAQAGDSPPGTIVSGACATPTPTPTQATSTIDQVQQNVYNGYVLFFLTLFITVSIFVWILK